MNSKDSSQESQQAIQNEIAELEKRLHAAKARLSPQNPNSEALSTPPSPRLQKEPSIPHFLLLLSDSALPLGSFAFSSGLESYLAHSPRPYTATTFPHFLSLSLSSYGSTTLPFVLATYRNPEGLLEYDDVQDAAVMCTVGRRASVAQGRALLGIWERSFSSSITIGNGNEAARGVIKDLSTLLRSTSSSHTTTTDLPKASAHLAPLFGLISLLLGMSIEQAAYVFMLSHVKALLSAAVRASMFGPYHAQKVLAGGEVQDGIRKAIEGNWGKGVEEAGQSVPVMDLWVGRHEMLYSRIFNS